MMTHEELMARGGRMKDGAAAIETIDPRLLVGETTYLFNIYSEAHTINLGTAGYYYVPPCPEDKEWIRSATPIPGTVVDTYPHFTDREVYRAIPRVGEDVVACALGIGPGQNKENEDLRRFGVFASKHETPTKADLAEARKHLVPYLQIVVRKADEKAASADPKLRESIDQKDYKAAQMLRVKRPWMSEAAEMTLCPFCSIAVRPQASICPGCNQIINQAAFDATKKMLAGAAA